MRVSADLSRAAQLYVGQQGASYWLALLEEPSALCGWQCFVGPMSFVHFLSLPPGGLRVWDE